MLWAGFCPCRMGSWYWSWSSEEGPDNSTTGGGGDSGPGGGELMFKLV